MNWIIASSAVLAALCPRSYGAPGFGNITGQISNKSTGSYLQSAIVTVKGTQRTAATDQQGRYDLSVPAGSVVLEVSYAGLDSEEATVVVPDNGTVEKNFLLSASVYLLDTFVVSSVREGGAAAVARQRAAPNAKNIVASDDFGNMADGNVGAFLQQLSGVTANYVGADVRSVMIRGLGPELSTVTMDGMQIASAPSGGATRTFEWEQASLGLIESIELTKSSTPNMGADSLGGNVNMVTKSAFDRSVSRFGSWQIGGVWRPKYQLNSREFVREPIVDIGPSLNFSYSDILGEQRRLGVMFNFTYHSQPGGDTAALQTIQQVADPAYITSVNVPRPAGAPRTRLALNGKIDYKLTKNVILTLNSYCNWFHENNDTRIHALATGASAANFRPGYTTRYMEVLPNTVSTSTISQTSDDKFGRTYGFAPSVVHKYPGLKIDYAASFSNSFTQWEHDPSKRHSPFHNPLGSAYPKGNVSASLTNVGWILDRRESPGWPKITQTAGADFYNLNNYKALSITNQDRGQEEVLIAANANLKKLFQLEGAEAYLQTGMSYREQKRNIWNMTHIWDYTGTDIGQFIDKSGQYSDANEGYRQPPWMSPYVVNSHRTLYPGQWAPRLTNGLLDSALQYLSNNRQATEKVSAVYLMGNVKVGIFSILSGLRVEDTRDVASGPVSIITAEEKSRRAAWVGAITPEEGNRRALAQYASRVTQRGQYRNVFPSVHTTYDIARNLKFRLEYAANIGRPSLENLIPRTTYTDTSNPPTVSESNPNLKPQFSNSFDASVEYYFGRTATFTAGVFLKEVKDFQFSRATDIYPTDPLYAQHAPYLNMPPMFRLTRMDNGGQARYRGFEFSYRQNFSFLPGYWSGLGAGVNFTKTASEGNYGSTIQQTLIAGIVPRTGNFMLYYVKGRLNIVVSTNWTDKVPTQVPAVAVINPYAVTWQKAKTTVNLRTKFYLDQRKTVNIFCDVDNVNRCPITDTYWGTPDRPREIRIVASKYVFGVQGRF